MVNGKLVVGFVCLFVLVFAGPAGAACVVPHDDLYITEDTILCPGEYTIDDVNQNGVIIIKRDNVNVVCDNTVVKSSPDVIFDDQRKGIVDNTYQGVTVKDCVFSGFVYGAFFDSTVQVNLIHNTFENSIGFGYGAGIYFSGATGSVVSDNKVTNNTNGVIFENSLGNSLSNNFICFNTVDISSSGSLNDGISNTCDHTSGDWADEGTTGGCLNSCPINPGDKDKDGKINGEDNCWDEPNADQADSGDNDCVFISKPYKSDPHCGDACDNCPLIYNRNQEDEDHDDVGDVCDTCPHTPEWEKVDAYGCELCMDSDHGKNYYEMGIVGPRHPDSPQYSDYCTDGQYLVEYYCDDGVIKRTWYYDCKDPQQYQPGDPPSSCSEGKCCFDLDSDLICDLDDPDRDGDGCLNEYDPYPDWSSADPDNDHIGNDCDIDRDGDGCQNEFDKNPDVKSDNPDGDWWANDCDNCPTIWNDQSNHDTDPFGDACDDDDDNDGCLDPVDKFRIDWHGSSDSDSVPDDCDDCPTVYNAQGFDWDHDGVGDACDCNDGWMGPNEDGADCGSSCGITCREKYYPDRIYWDQDAILDEAVCVPIAINGDTYGKIDIVFMRAGDYGEDRFTFLRDVRSVIDESYLSDTLLGPSRNKINFWFIDSLDNTAPIRVDANGACKWDTIGFWVTKIGFGGSSHYVDWREICPGADIGAILHVTPCRDHAEKGGVYSADHTLYQIPLHESGHAIFGLADLYDDSGATPPCGTNYAYYGMPNLPNPNIYPDKASCQANSVTPANCNQFTTCSNGLWGAEGFYENIMTQNCSGGITSICGFGIDGTRRVTSVLNRFIDPPVDETRKALVEKFSYDGTDLVLLSSTIVYGGVPDRVLEWNGLRLISRDSGGAEVGSFSIGDPRYVDYVNPPGGELLDETTFSIVLYFADNIKSLEVQDIQAGNKPLGVFDLEPAVRDFCSDHPSDPQCMTYDGDNDGVYDLTDKCPGTVLPEVFTKLNPNNYGDIDGDRVFEVGSAKGYADSTYTITKTSGCGCQQILTQKPGNNEGEKKFGCTKGTMENFIKKNK